MPKQKLTTKNRPVIKNKRKNGNNKLYLINIDIVLATMLVFALIIAFIYLEKWTSIFDSKEISAKDFSYVDLSYKLLGKRHDMPSIDTGIVIVNIGNSDRRQIADLLKKIVVDSPKVIGLDVFFNGPKNRSDDSALLSIFRQNQNIVTSYLLDSLNHKPLGVFYQQYLHSGFANFTVGDDQNVIREFDPVYADGKKKYLSFAAAVVKKTNDSAYNQLITDHPSRTAINYEYTPNNYLTASAEDINSGLLGKKDLKNKIVLFGYISNDVYDCHDKHYTPMNSKFAGLGLPDLNGIIIHANIIQMVLNRNYVHKANGWLIWTIAFLWCLLHMALFAKLLINREGIYTIAAKIIQAISACLLIYISIILFFWWRVEIDMGLPVFAVIAAVDILYFYQATAHWTIEKVNRFRYKFKMEPLTSLFANEHNKKK